MKYHMRKSEREIKDRNDINNIIFKCKYAVIAMCKENQPYILPISYGFDPGEDALYFHTAMEGLKMEFLRQNPNVCATVVDDEGYIDGDCKHKYSSVIIFGRVEFVEDLEGKKKGMGVMLRHLEKNPALVEQRLLKNDDAFVNCNILKLVIEDITGKKGT